MLLCECEGGISVWTTDRAMPVTYNHSGFKPWVLDPRCSSFGDGDNHCSTINRRNIKQGRQKNTDEGAAHMDPPPSFVVCVGVGGRLRRRSLQQKNLAFQQHRVGISPVWPF